MKRPPDGKATYDRLMTLQHRTYDVVEAVCGFMVRDETSVLDAMGFEISAIVSSNIPKWGGPKTGDLSLLTHDGHLFWKKIKSQDDYAIATRYPKIRGVEQWRDRLVP